MHADKLAGRSQGRAFSALSVSLSFSGFSRKSSTLPTLAAYIAGTTYHLFALFSKIHQVPIHVLCVLTPCCAQAMQVLCTLDCRKTAVLGATAGAPCQQSREACPAGP